MRPIKVVIDTNIWISIIIGKRLSVLTSLLDNGEVRFVMSDKLISELEEVIARPKFRKYFTERVATGVMKPIVKHAEHHNINHYPARCRDPKDDYLLELAVQSQADYLITGDDDLLTLGRIGGTVITSAADFQNILSKL